MDRRHLRMTGTDFHRRLDKIKSQIDTVPPQYHAMLTRAAEEAGKQYERMERTRTEIANMTADLGLTVEHLKFHVAACRRELQQLDPDGRFSL